MQTKPNTESLPSGLKEVANVLRITGGLSFWVQLGLAAVCVLSLMFAITGRNFSTETNQGIGIGIFWAIGGLLVIIFNIYLAFRYTRIAKRLLTLTPERRPKKADTLRLIRLGLIMSLVGMLLNIFGAGSTIGVLVAKAVSQPPGVAITNPNQIIRGLDVFVTVANINGIAAHFVGNASSLWLLDRVHRY